MYSSIVSGAKNKYLVWDDLDLVEIKNINIFRLPPFPFVKEVHMNRADLQFADLVQKHFAFLWTQGFRCVENSPTFVRFESSLLFVNIYHGRSSYEIGAEIGRLGDENEKEAYPMAALLEAVGAPIAGKYQPYMAHTLNGVNEGVSELAKLFRDYLSQNLQNAGLFRVLKEQRKAWGIRFEQEVKLEQMRRDLDIAWHAKDYEKVVELLYPHRDVLTPIELHKLAYTEKKKPTSPEIRNKG